MYWTLLSVGVGLIVLFGAWWFRLGHVPQNFSGAWHAIDFGLFVLLSYIVWHQILMDLLLWAISGKTTKTPALRPEPGLRVAFVTTFVPSKEPLDMLERTLRAMLAADYPHDVWVLDEGNDPAARELCGRIGAKHFSRYGIAQYNTADGRFATKTKGGNHNAWYHTYGHQYDVVAQIDTDFIPQPYFLTRTLGYFRDPTVAFVGTPQVYGNLSDSIVAKGAAQQTYGFYGPILRGFSGHSSTLLIGANHVVRVSALNDIGFYRAHLTEDLLTGMNLHSRKWRSMYVPEILAVGEGPVTWSAYFSQQMRWAFGCIDILFKHSASLMRQMDRPQAVHYFILQQHYFNGLGLAIGNLLVLAYLVFGINASALDLRPLLAIYGPLLLWQLLMSTWLQRLNVDPVRERGFLWAGRFVSIAAWPVYFLAFVGVIRGKRLSYKVTPKGEDLKPEFAWSTFAPQLVFGTLTALGLAASVITHNQAPVMLFWAALNTVLMYAVVANGAYGKVSWWLRRAWSQVAFVRANRQRKIEV